MIIISLGNDFYSYRFAFLTDIAAPRFSGALVTVPIICAKEILIKFINCNLLLPQNLQRFAILLSNTDTSVLRTVSNVPTKFSYILFKKKTSIIQTLSNTDNGH